MIRTPICVVVSLFLLSQGAARAANTLTVANTLDATIDAIGELSVTSAVTLTHSGTTFNAYTGSATVQYKARTTATGGGTITLEATTDFATGGPSISRGDLSYTCGTAGLGTACSSSVASTTSATTVVTLPKSGCTGGGTPCSSANPNTVAVNFSLTDNPIDKTGSYTANILFTISAT